MAAKKKTKAKTKAKVKAKAKTKTKTKTKTKAKTKKKVAARPAAKRTPKPKRSKKAAKNKPSRKPAMPKAPAKPKPAKRKPAKPTQPVANNPPAPKPAPAPSPRPSPAPANPQAPSGFEVTGTNAAALFTLKAHRGEGMTLLAMNWKAGQPPQNFVGFGIAFKPPGSAGFFPLKNRINFLDASGNVNPVAQSTLLAPIQKFRWVHFPHDASLEGDYEYQVTPMFMDADGKLSGGEPQNVALALARETYPGVADVTFTRGFVASQAFVDDFMTKGTTLQAIVAPDAKTGLDFKPAAANADDALAWMGFEARAAVLRLLDDAIADKTAEVRVVAFDFNLPEIVSRLEQLGSRLKIVIDDSKDHRGEDKAETEAETRLVASAGRDNVLRQHMGELQHNKTIAVSGTVNRAICGSTNMSWRGFYVQANNALVVCGAKAVRLFFDASDRYFAAGISKGAVAAFGATQSAQWNDLGLPGLDAEIAFSPHNNADAMLAAVAKDIGSTTSSLLYSLAFLYQTPGPILNAIKVKTDDDNIFVYGISDAPVGGLEVVDPNGNRSPISPAQLSENVPEPFKSEPYPGKGIRMHHKFVVIDFDKPTARVYLGSYNFSNAADLKNGENLVIVRDRRIAVSYMIEALTLFDHYSFRVAQNKSKEKNQKLYLQTPPRKAGDKPWWDDDYTVPYKIKDRLLFA